MTWNIFFSCDLLHRILNNKGNMWFNTVRCQRHENIHYKTKKTTEQVSWQKWRPRTLKQLQHWNWKLLSYRRRMRGRARNWRSVFLPTLRRLVKFFKQGIGKSLMTRSKFPNVFLPTWTVNFHRAPWSRLSRITHTTCFRFWTFKIFILYILWQWTITCRSQTECRLHFSRPLLHSDPSWSIRERLDSVVDGKWVLEIGFFGRYSKDCVLHKIW